MPANTLKGLLTRQQTLGLKNQQSSSSNNANQFRTDFSPQRKICNKNTDSIRIQSGHLTIGKEVSVNCLDDRNCRIRNPDSLGDDPNGPFEQPSSARACHTRNASSLNRTLVENKEVARRPLVKAFKGAHERALSAPVFNDSRQVNDVSHQGSVKGCRTKASKQNNSIAAGDCLNFLHHDEEEPRKEYKPIAPPFGVEADVTAYPLGDPSLKSSRKVHNEAMKGSVGSVLHRLRSSMYGDDMKWQRGGRHRIKLPGVVSNSSSEVSDCLVVTPTERSLTKRPPRLSNLSSEMWIVMGKPIPTEELDAEKKKAIPHSKIPHRPSIQRSNTQPVSQTKQRGRSYGPVNNSSDLWSVLGRPVSVPVRSERVSQRGMANQSVIGALLKGEYTSAPSTGLQRASTSPTSLKAHSLRRSMKNETSYPKFLKADAPALKSDMPSRRITSTVYGSLSSRAVFSDQIGHLLRGEDNYVRPPVRRSTTADSFRATPVTSIVAGG
eukprot:GHVN01094827.1.p1 GENE.GHVN01094827.1~~GHVN01094827.1.p1  ORF type:complete len:494 (+),score=73.13 GHVN01094827.1:44-1525(+)